MKCGFIGTCLKIEEHVDTIEVFKEYEDIFIGQGKLGEKYEIITDSSVSPTVKAARRIPIALMTPLKKKPDELEERKIIDKVNYPTDWVSPLVIVKKKDGDIRVCMDPHDLNLAIKRSHYQLPVVEDILPTVRNARCFQY